MRLPRFPSFVFFLAALTLTARTAQPGTTNVVLLLSEDEYKSEKTVPRFADQELKPRGMHCVTISSDPGDPNRFVGLEALRTADLMVLSARRRTPPRAQLQIIRDYLERGKPLVAIRTASHAFAGKGPAAAGRANWDTFDSEVLGATYTGYDEPARATGADVWAVPDGASHPVLRGLETAKFHSPSWIYKMRSLTPTATLLMDGRWPGSPVEPVAWVNTANGRRVFYTSLGHPDDFALPEFRLMLVNAVMWAMDQPAPGKLLVPFKPRPLEFQMQRREGGGSNRPVTVGLTIDPSKTGIVAIDMWNYHHCMTAAHRVSALVPRMNKVLDAARRLGMQVLWAPTDVVSEYAGTRQREAALGVRPFLMPSVSPIACPLRQKGKDCMCGPGLDCIRNFGWDGMQPGLRIDPADRMTLGAAELYSNCKQLGLTHLIYMGVHTNACIINRPEGIRAMAATGLKCMLARDLTDALTDYNPETGFTPDTGTTRTIEDIEQAGIPSIDLGAEMKRAEAWQDDVVVDPLMITPWGSESTPYLFTDATTVTLSAPRLVDAEIRYTLDGAFPRPVSLLYNAPLRLTGSAHIRAAAYRGGRRVSLVAEGEFARLGPMPPSPDVQIEEVKPIPSAKPVPVRPVRTGEAFNGGPLRVRGRTYAHGLGMRAPAGVLYEIQPSYDRFVARAGVDDDPYRQADRANHLAIHCSVRFEVFIDGKPAAESPVMRLSQEPWRFDVKIPEGSRRLSLAVTDAGSRSPLDLADWVEAGFVLKK